MKAVFLALFTLLMAPLAYAQDEDQAAIEFNSDTKPADFCKAVDHALLDGYFDELDATAKIALTLNHRLPGGEPELQVFYRGLAQADCVWDSICATDPDFDHRQQRLQEWRDHEPGVTTPVVALIRFWQVAAWTARGCGYANEVTPAKWAAFGQRLTVAAGYARQIKPEDDPEATRLLLELARDFNLPRQQLDAIFAAGRKNFPTYFGIYREYANLVQEKWSGRRDLNAPFMRSLLTDPGGDAGEVAYAFAATEMFYAVDGDDIYNTATGLDWPTLKRAYATRARLYGLGSEAWTTLCYFASVAGDRDAARDAFRHAAGQLSYFPKQGSHDFYLNVLPWIMARDDGPTDGPSHGR
jgi:hypothetical protein